MISVVTTSEAASRAAAQALADRLRPGDVVALHGPLGAGKTTFVRGLAEGLGIDPRAVSSPTFVLCHEYVAEGSVNGGGGVVLAHLDGYRLASPDELDSIGWDELLATSGTIVAVEWPERFGARLPADRVTVELAHVDEHTREIVITATGPAAARVEGLVLLPSPPRAPCPICGAALPAAPTAAPFCSERCRLVDLGKWFRGDYAIGQSPEPDPSDADDDF